MIPLYANLLDFRDIFLHEKNAREKLKSTFSALFNRGNTVLTTDGRNAIYVALTSMGLKKDDEIIIPAYTCKIVPNTVKKVCKPIYADIDVDTYNIDPEKIEEKITNKTRAVLIVHAYGNPCKMKEIMDIVRENNLVLIEDVAQALFGCYKKRLLGSFGDYSIFSFRFSKDITSFKGGALLTNKNIEEYSDKESNLLIKMKIFSVLLGFSFLRLHPMVHNLLQRVTRNNNFLLKKKTLSEYQCSLLNKQMKEIEKAIEKRRENAGFYNKKLKDVVITPKECKDCFHTYFRYSIRVENRDKLYNYMLSKGIQVDKMYDYSLYPQKCENSETVSKQILNIPVHHKLKKEELEKVVEAIHEFKRME
jgi:dTDP-4-amino-4,6-dideoxygalactose transaminase